MKRLITPGFLIALVCAGAALRAQAPVSCTGPLTFPEMVKLLSGHVAEKRVIQHVATCGVAFELTDERETILRSANGTDAVIAAVRGAIQAEQPKTTAQGTTPAAEVERFQRGCDAGDAVLCAEAGDRLERGYGLTPNVVLAAKVYQRGCDAGNGRSCAGLGRLVARGRGAAFDAASAARLHRRACDLGDPAGCSSYASVLSSGRGVGVDIGGSMQYLRKACDGRDAPACTQLGDLLLTGCSVAKNAIAKDPSRAQEFYDTGRRIDGAACLGGDQVACGRLASVYAAGRGVARDETKAQTFYGQRFNITIALCKDGDLSACAAVAIAHLSGWGTPKDVSRGVALSEDACARGYAPSCTAAALVYRTGVGGATRDEARAAALAQPACEAGECHACYLLVQMYVQGGGVAQDVRRTVQISERACDLGSAQLCRLSGAVYETGEAGVPADPRRAAELYQRGCDLGSIEACTALVGMMKAGKKFPGDTTPAVMSVATAIANFDRWCELPRDECVAPAGMSEKGDSVARDEQQVGTYHQGRCGAPLPADTRESARKLGAR